MEEKSDQQVREEMLALVNGGTSAQRQMYLVHGAELTDPLHRLIYREEFTAECHHKIYVDEQGRSGETCAPVGLLLDVDNYRVWTLRGKFKDVLIAYNPNTRCGENPWWRSLRDKHRQAHKIPKIKGDFAIYRWRTALGCDALVARREISNFLVSHYVLGRRFYEFILN